MVEKTSGTSFGDGQLDRRFTRLVNNLWCGIGKPIPFACQDWASTKAAYQFLPNEKVFEADILSGHSRSTEVRAGRTVTAKPGMILVLHDTTEFTYKRTPFDLIGVTNVIKNSRFRYSGRTTQTVGGLLMHSSLTLTENGLPLGLAAIKFWTRKKFKNARALARKVNATRVPIDTKESFHWLDNVRRSTELIAHPNRCVHIGDRGSDIYELFCLACETGTHFLTRTCVDRLASDGRHTVSREMQATPVKGFHCVVLQDHTGKTIRVKLALKYRSITVLPPIGKRKKYPPLLLTVLHEELPCKTCANTQ